MRVRATLILTACALGVALIAAPGYAYHDGTDLICEDCHVMHASETGVGTFGNPNLLRAASTQETCLYCHDETNSTNAPATTPFVANDAAGTPAAVTNPTQGGTFGTDGLSGAVGTGSSHTLGVAHATVPLSTATNLTISCADCHEPHGTANYRNIPDSVNSVDLSGTPMTVTEPTGTAPSKYYASGQSDTNHYDYDSGVNEFCQACHDSAAYTHTEFVSSDTKHPTEDAFIGETPAVPATAPYGTTGNTYDPDIPVLDVGGNAATVETTDELMCLTCHRAHGTTDVAWKDILRFDSDASLTDDKYCDACHDKI